MSKRSSKNKPKSFSEAIGIKDRFESDTVNFFIGLVMLAIAVYLVIAMVSYLTTGQADQSVLESLKPADFSIPTTSSATPAALLAPLWLISSSPSTSACQRLPYLSFSSSRR